MTKAGSASLNVTGLRAKVRSPTIGISEAYSPHAGGPTGVLHGLITNDVSPKSRPEDMRRTNSVFFEDKAGPTHRTISSGLGPIVQDFAPRLFLVDGVEYANDIAKPVPRRGLPAQRPRFTLKKCDAFSIYGLEKALHPIGHEPEVVKELPIVGCPAERAINQQSRRLGERRKASLARRRHQSAASDIFHSQPWRSAKSKIEPYAVEFSRLWLPQALLGRGCSHELSLSRRVLRLIFLSIAISLNNASQLRPTATGLSVQRKTGMPLN